MDEDLAFAPVETQAGLVRAGDVSPTELVELYLERIDRHDPALGAYFTVAAEQARAAARDAEDRLGSGADLPPYLGVPIAVKDLTDTAGIRTTYGTRAWRDRVPDRDTEVVHRIKEAGFVILGKTSTPEFGAAPVTEPPGFPPGRNPWDPSRTPGGSSGGAAAAAAAALCAVSHGSDAGGSIRIPSALCGCVGIKPTRGRVSTAPLSPELLVVEGSIGRSVADAAALLDAMEGYATGDPYWVVSPERPFVEEVAHPPGGLRIAWTAEPFLDGVEVASANRDVARDAADLLADLGHAVVEGRPAWSAASATREMAIVGAALSARADLPPDDELDPVNRFMLEAGRMLSAAQYLTMIEQLGAEAREAVRFFDAVDVLVTPTVPIPAPPVGEYTTLAEMEDLRSYLMESVLGGTMPRFGWLAAFTAPWNVTGQPAVSVPLAVDADGLPVGVQLVGRAGAEATLVRLAGQLERERPWAARRPPPGRGAPSATG
ncbi:MAG: amidase [Acidimicrobiia bacterium]